MIYPSHAELKEAFIEILNDCENNQIKLSVLYKRLADYFHLTNSQRVAQYCEVKPDSNNTENYWKNHVRTAKARLVDEGVLIKHPGRGICKLNIDYKPIYLKAKLDNNFVLPEEISQPTTFVEGAKRQITINSFERNPQAREACITHHGTSCIVCKTSLFDKYGEIGKGVIHVHHIIPLSEINEKYEINPVEDLVPVCPNCHTILHRKNPPLTIEELKDILHKIPN